jgi:cell wall-associated NlpC family hydrolase
VNWQPSGLRLGRTGMLVAAGIAVLVVFGLITAPMMIFGGSDFFSRASSACGAAHGAQPPPSKSAKNSIPINYLRIFQRTGKKTNVPWVILAGIGKVESDDGRSNLPGVHSGSNAFGAAGPMQIGIGGASGNTWGGTPIHKAKIKVNGVASDGDNNGVDNVYDPADAVAGAAKYLLAHGVIDNPQGAIFAYNHLQAYVTEVLSWAHTYASGGYTVGVISADNAPGCLPGTSGQNPNKTTGAVIAFAQAQLGKPYQWGGTGPDAFDCSGLVMEAYRAAGISIPRTSEVQWIWGPRISEDQAQPGDLVFFAGSDGTRASPGHVGLVIGGGLMIEAYATGYPIRVAPYRDRDPVGFTRPWAHHGVVIAEGAPPPGA